MFFVTCAVNMKIAKIATVALVLAMSLGATAQPAPQTFTNPILPGFNPDPSVCRVGEDYYLVTSSFTWYPGLPVYHSRDLVNWKLIGHALDRPGMVDMDGLNDNDGIWAPTIRYRDGLFYIITTASKSGGNFYITAKDPQGPWSDPVWLEGVPGIDPSLFWDDDGRCYYTGNTWDFKKSWPAQCAVWMQEIDLAEGRLVGERKTLTYGHANNATYAEGPHLYKTDGRYLLLMAEGGSGYHHAVTAHQSDSLWGPYVACKSNPVLTHRHLGKKYPIQNLGHADLVQTQSGEWYSVALGTRTVGGFTPLGRETFLCKVEFEDGTPVYNPGHGIVLQEQERPDLPWTPVEKAPEPWYFVRVPKEDFFRSPDKGNICLSLQPEVIDSLVSAPMMLRKVTRHSFTAGARLDFRTGKENEEAGIVLYRTANGYYSLMKGKDGIVLTRKHLGKKETLAKAACDRPQVFMKVEVDGTEVRFSFGDSPDRMVPIGGTQKIDAVSDNAMNKFNGPGVGIYASSNGRKSGNEAIFDNLFME